MWASPSMICAPDGHRRYSPALRCPPLNRALVPPDTVHRRGCGGPKTYRAARDRKAAVPADEPVRIDVSLPPTDAVLKPGPPLRVDIYAASFPRYLNVVPFDQAPRTIPAAVARPETSGLPHLRGRPPDHLTRPPACPPREQNRPPTRAADTLFQRRPGRADSLSGRALSSVLVEVSQSQPRTYTAGRRFQRPTGLSATSAIDDHLDPGDDPLQPCGDLPRPATASLIVVDRDLGERARSSQVIDSGVEFGDRVVPCRPASYRDRPDLVDLWSTISSAFNAACAPVS